MIKRVYFSNWSFFEVKKVGAVNGGVNPVLEFSQNNPLCRIPAVVEATGISKRTVERIIKKLKEDGVIEFVGAPKTGGYDVK